MIGIKMDLFASSKISPSAPLWRWDSIKPESDSTFLSEDAWTDILTEDVSLPFEELQTVEEVSQNCLPENILYELLSGSDMSDSASQLDEETEASNKLLDDLMNGHMYDGSDSESEIQRVLDEFSASEASFSVHSPETSIETSYLGSPHSMSSCDTDWVPTSPTKPTKKTPGRKKSGLSETDKKERKKSQNVEAARRYRDKKKTEASCSIKEVTNLEIKNKKLKEIVKKMEGEVGTLKNLLTEMKLNRSNKFKN